ncbi:MerR family transcriptional regulator [Lactobacillus sp. S2-2]|uniref:MerR family transcriptional regulator n=1 Tax=Lactobacillus sp. S2-2 TaxID=2692917 RepID=UPI001F30B402|nr:MerR family transcriptional regulator [Lactobacillus sp. S2-2]MCF6515915.1 MerR family transcriptional regulator [Lactobacillus sp. S2-2]
MNINAISKEFNLSKDTLRYWERIGLLPKIKRNSSGYREYSETDKNWVFYIQVLRNAGMTIESLIEFVDLYRSDNNTNETRKSLLIEQRDLLEQEIKERQKTINYLSYKINNYDSHTLKYENEKLAYENNKEEK